MPARSAISKLPPRVLAQLDRRLVADSFGSIVATAAWLQSKGHRIGKTAVGQYSKRLKAQAETDTQAMKAAMVAPGSVALRLACLQAAARQPGSAAAVLKRAEAYAAWARTGKAQGPR